MINEINEFLKQNLKPSRFAHTLGVAEEAVKLAQRYGCDCDKAHLAAMVHDCCKNMTAERLLSLADELGVQLDEISRRNEKLLHAPVGAAFAKKYFKIEDTELLSAVACHTTGRADMTLLDKIIYIADYIEPNRSGYDWLEPLRALAYEDIDKAVLSGLDISIRYLLEDKLLIHEDTVSARNFLIMRGVTL